mmetsp:Transcript_19084/g.29278  ORF Transcript_19084/g.29278 Transcript_19084/m.29278 type:complete len:87 (+) Transcript_19084:425-685(+)
MMDEDLVFYSDPFCVNLMDLLTPDILQTYAFSQVKFHSYFIGLPYHLNKTCLTKASPEILLDLLRKRANFEISQVRGVYWPDYFDP